MLHHMVPQPISFIYSIIQKASNALDVLREVLDAVNPQHPDVC